LACASSSSRHKHCVSAGASSSSSSSKSYHCVLAVSAKVLFCWWHLQTRMQQA
jgi:hypothetical protein